MTPVTDAVILMAGLGSRLRKNADAPLKPLTTLLGRPLISYTFEILVNGGITNVLAIVGFQSETLIAQVQLLIPDGLNVEFIENSEWEKQNGVSVLAAANHVSQPFILTMSDHLFDQSIVDLTLAQSNPDELNLAVDRKIETIVDLDDATKVRTKGDRIVEIGKTLTSYDAIDTGLFVCPVALFDHLEQSKQNGDCSLSDGVRAMAAVNKAHAIDIGGAWWQDIDTLETFAAAEKHLGR